MTVDKTQDASLDDEKKQSHESKKQDDKKLDDKLEDTFPASDAATKY